MSYCKKIGKDKIIFATKEDHQIPSTVTLPEPEETPGLIFPNGEVNWNCPCLGGMATGPCGVQFRKAFTCFHFSEAEPQGADCYEEFTTMQNCMAKYPTLYKRDNDDDDDDDDDKEDPLKAMAKHSEGDGNEHGKKVSVEHRESVESKVS